MKKTRLVNIVLLVSLFSVFTGCAPLMNTILDPNDGKQGNVQSDTATLEDKGTFGKENEWKWYYYSDGLLHFIGDGDFPSTTSYSPWSKYKIKTVYFSDGIENVKAINGITNVDKVSIGNKTVFEAEFFEHTTVNTFDTARTWRYSYYYKILKQSSKIVYCCRDYETDFFTVDENCTLGAYSFKDCTKIKTIFIPSTVEKVEHDCFANWTSEQTIYVEDVNEVPKGWSSSWLGDSCEANVYFNCTKNGPRPDYVGKKYEYKDGTATYTLEFLEDNTYIYASKDTKEEYNCITRKGRYEKTDYGFKLTSLTYMKNDYNSYEWKGSMFIDTVIYKNEDYLILDAYAQTQKYSSTKAGSYNRSFSYALLDDYNKIIGVAKKAFYLTFYTTGKAEKNYYLKFEYNKSRDTDESETYTSTFRKVGDIFWWKEYSDEPEAAWYVSNDVLVKGTPTQVFKDTSKTSPKMNIEVAGFDKESYSVSPSGNIYLSTFYYPCNYEWITSPEKTYTSSDTSVATVDAGGKVYGVSEGTATITLTIGDLKATCEIIVK